MFPDQRPPAVLPHSIQHHVKLRALGAPALHILSSNVGYRAHSVGYNLAFEVAAELRNVFVIGIEHGDSSGGERLDELILRARNAGKRIKKLQVHGSDVGHNANVGPRDLRQRANFSGMRHPHFDDRDIVLGL